MLKGLIERTVASGALGRDANVATVARAAQRAAEYIDRSQIERNAEGSEEPHSNEPSLWKIGEAEVDLADGHTYVFGQQLWYLSSRARERIAEGRPIAAQPMNRKARESKIAWIPEP